MVGDALFESSSEGMVVVRDIEVNSLCEHHMLPFFGRVHIAYLPAGRVLGLSKLARLADVFAKRLQIQERLTEQVARAVLDACGARGVAVMVDCQCVPAFGRPPPPRCRGHAQGHTSHPTLPNTHTHTRGAPTLQAHVHGAAGRGKERRQHHLHLLPGRLQGVRRAEGRVPGKDKVKGGGRGGGPRAAPLPRLRSEAEAPGRGRNAVLRQSAGAWEAGVAGGRGRLCIR